MLVCQLSAVSMLASDFDKASDFPDVMCAANEQVSLFSVSLFPLLINLIVEGVRRYNSDGIKFAEAIKVPEARSSPTRIQYESMTFSSGDSPTTWPLATSNPGYVCHCTGSIIACREKRHFWRLE
jgi:hypothetical protein